MRVTELSFSEIWIVNLEGFSMFYLYIDEVLVSQTKNFSEILSYILNYYCKLVKPNARNTLDTVYEISYLVYGSLHGLILHQYDYFKYLDHEVQIYYGYEK